MEQPNLNHGAQSTILAVFGALVIGIVNLACGWIVYQSIFSDSPQNAASVAEALPSEISSESIGWTGESVGPVRSGRTASTRPAGRQSINLEPRQGDGPIIIGAQPQPSSVQYSSDGIAKLTWCKGDNGELPEEVCAALISIASNPTDSNPHVGKNMRKWLSMLPPSSSVSIQEESWHRTSETSGTIVIALKTETYGDIKMLVTLQKSSLIWVVTDGKAA